MQEKQYENLIEVKHCYTQEQVNRLLKAGWKLLCVAPYEEPGESYLIYSFGRFKTQEDIQKEHEKIQKEILEAVEKDYNF